MTVLAIAGGIIVAIFGLWAIYVALAVLGEWMDSGDEGGTAREIVGGGVVLIGLLAVVAGIIYLLSPPPIPLSQGIQAYRAGQRYTLLALPVGASPVALDRYGVWENCEEQRQSYVWQALDNRSSVPNLRCDVTLPWWGRAYVWVRDHSTPKQRRQVVDEEFELTLSSGKKVGVKVTRGGVYEIRTIHEGESLTATDEP